MIDYEILGNSQLLVLVVVWNILTIIVVAVGIRPRQVSSTLLFSLKLLDLSKDDLVYIALFNFLLSLI